MSGSLRPIDLGIPDITVVIRENTDANKVLVDVPNISVNIEKLPDYKVSIQPSSLVVQRTGSLPSLAVSALFANTASYALGISGSIDNAISSSYALTASYATNAGAGAGFPFSGSAVVTGSLYVSGSEISGSFKGDGSQLTNLPNTLSGGVANYIPRWTGTGSLGTSILYQTGSSILFGGATSFFDEQNPDAFGLYAGARSSFNLISAHGTTNNYLQINVRNFSTGSLASTDIVATSDTGNETTGYIDMGINSALYSGSHIYDIPNDGYLYTIGNNLVIGTATPSASAYVTIFAGGDTYAAGKLRLFGNNKHQLTGSLEVTGAITASLYGTASVADAIDIIFAGTYETGSDAPIALQVGGVGNVISASYAVTASYAINAISGSTVSSSYSLTASYAEKVGSGPTIPAGTISSSTQVQQSLPLGMISGSTGVANYIPLWENNYKLKNSILYQTGSSILLNGTSFFDQNARDILGIYAGVVDTFNLISAYGTIDDYLQINIRNFSTGSNASSDIVATSDSGTETNGYINMGINSTNYVGTAIHDGAGDGYLYSTGSILLASNLIIGAATPSSSVVIFAGGQNYSDGKLRLRADGQHQLTGSLTTTTGINTPSVSNLNGTLDLITAGNNVRVLASNFAVPNGGISTGFNVVANTSVQTPILNNSGNGISINDNVGITGSLTVSGSSTFTNIGPAVFSGSVNTTSGITGSLFGTASVAQTSLTASYALNAGQSTPAGTVSSSIQVKSLLPSGTVSSSLQINTGSFSGSITSASYALTASFALNAGQNIPAGTVSSSAQYPGWVTSSAQINTGSFSGSFTGSLTGTITSASYAVTASYAVSAIAIVPAGTVSSSAQYPGWVTSSTQIVNALPTGTVSSSTQITAYNIFATTGSNTFNGNQIITGSLSVSSTASFNGAATANDVSLLLTNSSSLLLTSGSSLYVAAPGYVTASITGSITGSVQANIMVLPTLAPVSPQTGSVYFSGSFIYVYTGTQYRSASLA